MIYGEDSTRDPIMKILQRLPISFIHRIFDTSISLAKFIEEKRKKMERSKTKWKTNKQTNHWIIFIDRIPNFDFEL